MVHAHKELNLPSDPTFPAMLMASSVVALFYGHIHVAPWGLVGRYPNTSIPIFNCGAGWYNVYCLAEFGEDGFRVSGPDCSGGGGSCPAAGAQQGAQGAGHQGAAASALQGVAAATAGMPNRSLAAPLPAGGHGAAHLDQQHTQMDQRQPPRIHREAALQNHGDRVCTQPAAHQQQQRQRQRQCQRGTLGSLDPREGQLISICLRG